MMLKKSAPSRVLAASIAIVTVLGTLLAACNKPPAAPAPSPSQSVDATRFLYVVSCDGRVDKLDTRERKLLSSFTLSEKSGNPPAVPSLASAGGQIDGCLAQRIVVDHAGKIVSLIAPKDARLDASGMQDFQALSFALPSWTLTSAQPAGKAAVAPWLQTDAAGALQVLTDPPALSAAPLDLRDFKGAGKDVGGLTLQSSGDVSLVSLLLKDSTALAVGLANTKTRTLVQLSELPQTTLPNVHLAPGGGFVLIELTTSATNQRSGALRLYDSTGKPVADLTDDRIPTLRFVAITPNGLAVYSDRAGAYHFVLLGKTFGAAAVAQSPLAQPAAAPAQGLVFAAE